MRSGSRERLCALLLLALSFTAGGQDEDSPAPELIDEITVYGEKSLVHLKREVNIAQESMFEIFNTINSNDAFAVQCEYRKRLETRRRYLDCVPNFMTLPRAQIGSSSYTYVRNGKDDPNIQTPYIKMMNKQFWTEVARLLTENPELRREFERLAAAHAALEVELEKRRNK